MAKVHYQTGDAVKVTDADGKVFKGEVTEADHHRVMVKVPAGHRTSGSKEKERDEFVWCFFPSELEREPFGDYGLRIEPWTETPPTEEPAFTVLDAEGRAALKVGDRVLVECTVARAEPDRDGDLTFRSNGGRGLSPYEVYAKPESVYAKLPAAEAKKEIAVGDFVSILRRTGSKGKVLAFMSNGHAVVEYVAGDDFNAGHYDVSCLEVI